MIVVGAFGMYGVIVVMFCKVVCALVSMSWWVRIGGICRVEWCDRLCLIVMVVSLFLRRLVVSRYIVVFFVISMIG